MASNRNYRRINWDKIPLKETTNTRRPEPPKKKNEIKAKPYERRGRTVAPLKSNEVKPRKYIPAPDTYSDDEFEEDSDEYDYDSFEEDDEEYDYDSFEEDEEETEPYKVKEYLKQPYIKLSREQKEFIDKVYDEKPELLTWEFAKKVQKGGNKNKALLNLKRDMGQDNEPENNDRINRELFIPPNRLLNLQDFRNENNDQVELPPGPPGPLVRAWAQDGGNPEIDIDRIPPPGPLRREVAGGIRLEEEEPIAIEGQDFLGWRRPRDDEVQLDREGLPRFNWVRDLRQEELRDLEEFFRPRGPWVQGNDQLNRQNNLNAKNEFDTFMKSVDEGVKEELERRKEEDKLRASGYYDEEDDDWDY